MHKELRACGVCHMCMEHPAHACRHAHSQAASYSLAAVACCQQCVVTHGCTHIQHPSTATSSRHTAMAGQQPVGNLQVRPVWGEWKY